MRQFFVLLAGLVAISSSAAARDLWLVSWGIDNAFFVDVDSGQKVGKSSVEYWVDRYDVSDDGVVYLAARALTRYDCVGKRSAWVSYIMYLPSGRVEDSGDVREITWNRLAPGTVGMGVLDFACAPASKRPKLGLRIAEGDADKWAIKAMQNARESD